MRFKKTQQIYYFSTRHKRRISSLNVNGKSKDSVALKPRVILTVSRMITLRRMRMKDYNVCSMKTSTSL